MNIVKFTETALTSKNKTGILKPDENGYYTLIVGGLNMYNSAGEYYTSKEAIKLFESSSHLMRRIKSGALYAELGHPKKDPNMNMESFYNRIITVDERNVCAHISEIWLDLNYGKEHPEYNSPDMIAILAKVKPAGAKANALETTISDPKQNIAFSIRGITENKYKNGRVERALTQIITWDYVLEAGLNIANKWNSPVLEDLGDYTISKDVLINMAKKQIESNIATENSKSMCREIVNSFSIQKNNGKVYTW